MAKQKDSVWWWVAAIVALLWFLSRRRPGDFAWQGPIFQETETSSVVMTSGGGEDVMQECLYADGSHILWPVSQGACPATNNAGSGLRGYFR